MSNKNLNFFKNLEKAKIKQENKKIAQKLENKNQTRIDKFLVTVKENPPKPPKNSPDKNLGVKT